MTTLRIPEWLADTTASGVVTLVALVAAVYLLVKRVHPRARRFVHLIDDLAGEEAGPGVPARPGRMERVATVERVSSDNRHSMQEMLARFEPVEAAVLHLLPNRGHHVADSTKRTEEMVRAVSLQMRCTVPNLPSDLEEPPGP
ncbi:MAG: hypothetical protein ACYCTH_13445 [Cellulomonas sp.]